jgi:hypothetical protein
MLGKYHPHQLVTKKNNQRRSIWFANLIFLELNIATKMQHSRKAFGISVGTGYVY